MTCALLQAKPNSQAQAILLASMLQLLQVSTILAVYGMFLLYCTVTTPTLQHLHVTELVAGSAPNPMLPLLCLR